MAGIGARRSAGGVASHPSGSYSTGRTPAGIVRSARSRAKRRSLDHDSATGAPIGSPMVIERGAPSRPGGAPGAIRARAGGVGAVPIQISLAEPRWALRLACARADVVARQTRTRRLTVMMTLRRWTNRISFLPTGDHRAVIRSV